MASAIALWPWLRAAVHACTPASLVWFTSTNGREHKYAVTADMPLAAAMCNTLQLSSSNHARTFGFAPAATSCRMMNAAFSVADVDSCRSAVL
jgi:hypothetical protein